VTSHSLSKSKKETTDIPLQQQAMLKRKPWPLPGGMLNKSTTLAKSHQSKQTEGRSSTITRRLMVKILTNLQDMCQKLKNKNSAGQKKR